MSEPANVSTTLNPSAATVAVTGTATGPADDRRDRANAPASADATGRSKFTVRPVTIDRWAVPSPTASDWNAGAVAGVNVTLSNVALLSVVVVWLVTASPA